MVKPNKLGMLEPRWLRTWAKVATEKNASCRPIVVVAATHSPIRSLPLWVLADVGRDEVGCAADYGGTGAGGRVLGRWLMLGCWPNLNSTLTSSLTSI